MSSSTNNMSDDVHHSNPIPIGGGSARGRSRSMSTSSTSSGSMSSNDGLPTPPSSMGQQRISIPSPSTSPILSYFMAQSPAKSPAATFPLRRAFPAAAPVFEAEEEAERAEPPVAAHARRASVNAANRFAGQNTTAVPEALQGRGSGVLRRLSLSSTGFTKPQTDSFQRPGQPPSPPPNTAVSNSPTEPLPFTKARRSTISADGLKARKRAPSPMGERILKGHFDGFN